MEPHHHVLRGIGSRCAPATRACSWHAFERGRTDDITIFCNELAGPQHSGRRALASCETVARGIGGFSSHDRRRRKILPSPASTASDMGVTTLDPAYRLSPMQQGMLLHNLDAPQSGACVRRDDADERQLAGSHKIKDVRRSDAGY